jgi:hypothetical protein
MVTEQRLLRLVFWPSLLSFALQSSWVVMAEVDQERAVY